MFFRHHKILNIFQALYFLHFQLRRTPVFAISILVRDDIEAYVVFYRVATTQLLKKCGLKEKKPSLR